MFFEPQWDVELMRQSGLLLEPSAGEHHQIHFGSTSMLRPYNLIISIVDIIVCVIVILTIVIVAARLGFVSIINPEKPSQLI